MTHRIFLFLLIITLATGVGCKGKRQAAPAPTERVSSKATSHKPRGKAGAKAGPRQRKRGPRPPAPRPASLVRSLVREAARAELDQGGLLLDFGSSDQHKYLRGSYRVSLGRAGHDAGGSFQTFGMATPLRWHDWSGGVTSVVLRARSAGKTSDFGLGLDGQHIGSLRLSTTWKTLEVKLKSPTKPGRRRLVLEVEGDQASVDGVVVDWIWLRRREGPPPSVKRTGVKVFGDPRRSLLGGPNRRYTFYLHLDRKSELLFAMGADKPTEFRLALASDGKAEKVLLSTRHSGAWKKGRVDLSPWTGQTVRLRLLTAGDASGAAWAEPEVRPLVRVKRPPRIKRTSTAQNLVQLVVDTARQDVYAAFSPKTRVHAPAARLLSRKGTTFSRAYTNANFTLPSVASFLSGRHFVSFFGDINDKPKVPETLPLLPQYLKKQGFTTVALVANPYISEPFGLHRGWGTLRHFDSAEPSGTAAGLFAKASAWLDRWMADPKNRKRRFYLYVHTMDPHMPYFFHQETTGRYQPKPYRGNIHREAFNAHITDDKPVASFGFSAADRRYIRALYDGEISFHDKHLKGFLQTLERHGLFKNTMVVHSNDHGEELFDHAGLGHGTTLYDEQIRAPLVIVHPHLYPAGARVADLVSLVDLAPTILEGLGLRPMRGTHGRSLYATANGVPDATMAYVFAASENRAVVLGRHKLILGAMQPRLYDLISDPGERQNRAEAEPIALRACEVALSEANAVPAHHFRLHRVNHRRIKPEKAVLDHTTFQQLKGLGYIK